MNPAFSMRTLYKHYNNIGPQALYIKFRLVGVNVVSNVFLAHFVLLLLLTICFYEHSVPIFKLSQTGFLKMTVSS